MQSTVDLVVRAQAGDRQAFAELYSSLWQDLYKTAYLSLRNPDDASDVVSETVVEAYRGIVKLRNPESFRAWIFKILSVQLGRQIKQYMKERGNAPLDELDLRDASVADPDDRLETDRLLEQLSVDERTMVVLHIYNGYTTKEIAHMLARPHGTICSKISRALKKLREGGVRE